MERIKEWGLATCYDFCLENRGASFFGNLYAAAGGGDPNDVVEAIWDLAWAGEITNDTMAPVRALLWGKARRRPPARSRRAYWATRSWSAPSPTGAPGGPPRSPRPLLLLP